MGSAAEKPDSVAIRRRPDKALRLNNRPCNLRVYDTPAVSDKAPGILTAQGSANPENTGAKTSTQCVKFSAQPSEQVAANSNSSIILPEFLQGHASKSQLTMVVISCLSIGAILGYHWSSSMSEKSVLIAPELIIAEPVRAQPEKLQSGATQPASIPVIASQAQATAEAKRTASKLAELKAKHLEEVQWLKNQNRRLKLQVDALNQESEDLNRELLKLELQVTALKQLSEPSTETRIVYNYVNVPIGNETDANRNFTLRSEPVITRANTEIDTEADDSSSVQGLTLNAPQSDDDLLTDEQYMDEYSQTDEQFMDENPPGDLSDQKQWEQYNSENPVDRELIYDPETGFYINERFVGDEDEISADGNQANEDRHVAN
ncbi:MAG: hypothetical protein AB8B87_04045 [Granulosicoccus sp.]